MNTRRSAKAKANGTSLDSENTSHEDNEPRPNNAACARENMPSLFPVPPSANEQKVESTQKSTASNTTTRSKTKRPNAGLRFPLRSEPAPDIRLTSKGTKSTQQEETKQSDPTSHQRTASKPSAEKKSKDLQQTTHPLTRSGAAKSRSQPLKSSQERQRERSSEASKMTGPSKNQPFSSTKKNSSHQASARKNGPSSRSPVYRKTSEKHPDGPSLDDAVKNVQEKMMEKYGTSHAQNNVQISRTKMLPLPIGNPIPPSPRIGTRQTVTIPPRKVTRRLSADKDSARPTPTRKNKPGSKPPPKTSDRRKLKPQPSGVADKSRRPSPANNSRKRVSQSSTGSNNDARQTRTRNRNPINFLSNEYDSESPQRGFQDMEVPPIKSKTGSSKYESDSSVESDGYESDSISYEDDSTSDSETETTPTRRGKTISVQVLRKMVPRPDLGNSDKVTKERRKEPSGKSIDKPAAQNSLAGKSIARKTVAHKTFPKKTLPGTNTKESRKGTRHSTENRAAHKSIAEKSMAEKTVAGKTIAGKTLRQINIPSRRVHAGGVRHDSNASLSGADHQPQRRAGKTLRNPAKNEAEKHEDNRKKNKGDAPSAFTSERTSESSFESEEYEDDSESDSGTEDSETEDSEDERKRGTQRNFQRKEDQNSKGIKIEYEKRRKEIRERCSKQLKEQKKEEYSSLVREEFFLEMEYQMYLQKQLKHNDRAAGALNDSMYSFETNIATLRLEGLQSLGCDLEAQNYRAWLKFIRASGRVLHKTADPDWKENFYSILTCLKSAHISEKQGETVTINVNKSQLNFMTDNWQLLPRALELLNVFSSEMFNIQTDGGGCQLQ